MQPRFYPLTADQIKSIHRASVRILDQAGVGFPGRRALKIFQDHGFRTSGEVVHITEDQLASALATVPATVKLVARNPEHNHLLGGDRPLLIGTTGPSQVLEADGTLRLGTLDDYDKIQKLVQTSPLPQGTAYKAIFPQEVPAQTAHLEMLYRSLTLTDHFAGGDSQNADNTRDTLNMVGLVFGGSDFLKKNTVVRVTVSVLSPLRYAEEQSESLIMLAESNQLPIISNMALLGSTGPLNLAEYLALGNAEIMSGIVLAQLVNPGAPVVYGSTSCPVEMKGLTATLGSPEALKLAQSTVDLARHYGLPSRTGGGLTDSLAPDGQAMAESALALNRAISSGADCLMHAFGMMGGYIGVSLEKWLMDEETAGLILAADQQLEVPEETPVEEIIRLGQGGNYLLEPSTLKKFRSLHQFKFFNKQAHGQWDKKGRPDSLAAAGLALKKRLASYEKPAIDPQLEKELSVYVAKRRNELA